jgi:hypothetical protein
VAARGSVRFALASNRPSRLGSAGQSRARTARPGAAGRRRPGEGRASGRVSYIEFKTHCILSVHLNFSFPALSDTGAGDEGSTALRPTLKLESTTGAPGRQELWDASAPGGTVISTPDALDWARTKSRATLVGHAHNVVERGHGKTEPGGGHRQSTARALPRGRLPALGSSGWTRVPFTQRRLEAAVYLSKEKQAGMGENPEREEKTPKLHLTRRFPLSPNRPENHDLLRSDTEDRPSPSTLEPSRRAASRRSGNPGRLPHLRGIARAHPRGEPRRKLA